MLKKPYTSLSRRVSYKFESIDNDLQYEVVSLPKGMEIVDGRFIVHEKIPTIVVIDIFKECAHAKPMDIGLANTVLHGDLVTKYAVNGLEDRVGVLAINQKMGPERILSAFKALVDIQKQYQNIIAVNLSISYDTPIRWRYEEFQHYARQRGFNSLQDVRARKSEFNELILEKELDRVLRKKYKELGFDFPPNFKEGERVFSEEKLEELFCNVKLSGQDYLILVNGCRTIRCINALIELGTSVYISAGQHERLYGPEKKPGDCWFSLANANIVSAHDMRYAYTFFATDYAQGTHWFRKRFKGFKLQCASDGIIKFESDELDFPLITFPLPHDFLLLHRISGTSFASPIKLNEDIKIKLQQKEWV